MKLIFWESNITHVRGHGTTPLDDDTAEKEVEKLNREYPELYHWTVDVPTA